MSSYAAINIRLKLKKDAPEHVRQFLDTYFFKTDIEKAMADLENAPLTPLCALKYYPGGVDNLTSMIAQCSSFHKHWCWRVKEDHPDFTLYESKASCTHNSTDEDLLVLLTSGLLGYLVVSDGDVLARVIYEESGQERVVIFNAAENHTEATDGYQHKWSDRSGDGSHPREESQYYDHVLTDDKSVDRFSRLVASGNEFYPPWNIAEIAALNNENKKEWDEETSAQWWG